MSQTQLCGSSMARGARVNALSPCAMNLRALLLRFFALISVSLTLGPWPSSGAESNAPQTAAARSEETNSQGILSAYSQLKEQLRATELAIEQNRKAAQESARHNAEVLAGRLQIIEEGLASQKTREEEVVQSFKATTENFKHGIFVATGLLGAIGLIPVVLMVYLQWRTVNGLRQMSGVLLSGRTFAPHPATATLAPADTHLAVAGSAEKANVRLLDALGQLEKRIYGLEQSNPPPVNGGLLTQSSTAQLDAQDQKAQAYRPNSQEASSEPGSSSDAPHISMLLRRGQSMLNLDKADAALACFNEVLELDPQNVEALAKKRTILERPPTFDEAAH